ncbi:MAG: carboxymuconolactone decarboxylase family protein [Nitrososphaerales archaeon]
MGLPLVEPKEASPEVALIYGRITKTFPSIPDWAKALANSPALLDGFWTHYDSLMRSEVLPKEARLMIGLDVANTDECPTCISGFEQMVRDGGFDESIIKDIEGKVVSPNLDEKVKAIMVASYAVTMNPHDLNGPVIDSFRNKLSDAELVEVVGTINLFESILETVHGLALHGEE